MDDKVTRDSLASVWLTRYSVGYDQFRPHPRWSRTESANHHKPTSIPVSRTSVYVGQKGYLDLAKTFAHICTTSLAEVPPGDETAHPGVMGWALLALTGMNLARRHLTRNQKRALVAPARPDTRITVRRWLSLAATAVGSACPATVRRTHVRDRVSERG